MAKRKSSTGPGGSKRPSKITGKQRAARKRNIIVAQRSKKKGKRTSLSEWNKPQRRSKQTLLDKQMSGIGAGKDYAWQ